VNWFRKGADGKFIWPGYGENMRVLQWIVERIQGHAKGEEHLTGVSPGYADLNWKGLDFTQAQYRQVTDIDAADWAREVALHAELFEQLAYHLPAPLLATMAEIRKRLAR
jgi:phosphoenolpyruvate carboxykinase (GTP)